MSGLSLAVHRGLGFRRWGWLGLPAMLLVGLLAPLAFAGAVDPAALLAGEGRVLVLRHALAPGTGDPDNFRVEDCSTQRNLDARGRAQAAAIGGRLRELGVAQARVHSSQWCRCLDTARLLDLGPVRELPALNSFFQRPQEREPNLAALRRFLDAQPRDGGLLVLVTHQVTVSALSSQFVGSGEGVVLDLQPGGGLRVLGRVGFDD
jgi:broad specificity phosphatase PhoE